MLFSSVRNLAGLLVACIGIARPVLVEASLLRIDGVLWSHCVDGIQWRRSDDHRHGKLARVPTAACKWAFALCGPHGVPLCLDCLSHWMALNVKNWSVFWRCCAMDDPTGAQASPSVAVQIMKGIPEGLERAQAQQMFIVHPLNNIYANSRIVSTIPSFGNALVHNPQFTAVLRMEFDIQEQNRLKPAVNFTILDPATADPADLAQYTDRADDPTGWYFDNNAATANPAYVAADQWLNNTGAMEAPKWDITDCAAYYDFDGDPIFGYYSLFTMWRMVVLPGQTALCEVKNYFAHVMRQISQMNREQLAQYQLAIGCWQAFEDQMIDASSSLPVQQTNVKMIATRVRIDTNDYASATKLIVERELRLPFPFEMKNWPMLVFNEGLQLYCDFNPNLQQHFQQVPKHWGCYPIQGPNDICSPELTSQGWPGDAAAAGLGRNLETARHQIRTTFKLNPYQFYEGQLQGTFREATGANNTTTFASVNGEAPLTIANAAMATFPPDTRMMFLPAANGTVPAPFVPYREYRIVANPDGNTVTVAEVDAAAQAIVARQTVAAADNGARITLVTDAAGAADTINFMQIGYCEFVFPKLLQRTDPATDITTIASMSRFVRDPAAVVGNRLRLVAAAGCVGVNYVSAEIMHVQLKSRDLQMFIGPPVLNDNGTIATRPVPGGNVPIHMSPLAYQGFMLYVNLAAAPPQNNRSSTPETATAPRRPLYVTFAANNTITTPANHNLNIGDVVRLTFIAGTRQPNLRDGQPYTVRTVANVTSFTLDDGAGQDIVINPVAVDNCVATVQRQINAADAQQVYLGENAISSHSVAVWVPPSAIAYIALAPKNSIYDPTVPDSVTGAGAGDYNAFNDRTCFRSTDDELIGDRGTVTIVFKRLRRPRVLVPRPAGRSFDGFCLQATRGSICPGTLAPNAEWPITTLGSTRLGTAAKDAFSPAFIDTAPGNDPEQLWDKSRLASSSACTYSFTLECITDFTNVLAGRRRTAPAVGNPVWEDATLTNSKPVKVSLIDTKLYYESVELDPAYYALLEDQLASPEGFRMSWVDQVYDYRTVPNITGMQTIDIDLNMDTCVGGMYRLIGQQRIGSGGYYPSSCALPFNSTRLLIQSAEQVNFLPEDWVETRGSMRPTKLPLYQRGHDWNTSHWNMPLNIKGRLERKRIDAQYAGLMANIRGASQLSMEEGGTPVAMTFMHRNNQWAFCWSNGESLINRGVQTNVRNHIWRLEFTVATEMWGRTWVSQQNAPSNETNPTTAAEPNQALTRAPGNREECVCNFTFNDMPTRLPLFRTGLDPTLFLEFTLFYVKTITCHSQTAGMGVGGNVTYLITE